MADGGQTQVMADGSERPVTAPTPSTAAPADPIAAQIDAMVAPGLAGTPAAPDTPASPPVDVAAATPPAAPAPAADQPAAAPADPAPAAGAPAVTAPPATTDARDKDGDGVVSEAEANAAKDEQNSQENFWQNAMKSELGMIIMLLAVVMNPQAMQNMFGGKEPDPNNPPELTPDQQQQVAAKLGAIANAINNRSEELKNAALGNQDANGQDFYHEGTEIGAGEGKYTPKIGNFAITKTNDGKDLAVLVTGFNPETNEVNYMLGTDKDGKPIMGVMKADEISGIIDSQGLGAKNPQALKDAVGLPAGGVEGPAQGQGQGAPGTDAPGRQGGGPTDLIPDTRSAGAPGADQLDAATRAKVAAALGGQPTARFAVGEHGPLADPEGNRIGGVGQQAGLAGGVGGIY